VYFDASLHDDGEKVVLGTKIPAGGGKNDVERLVDITCNHPSTAKHLAKKLVAHFVAEAPPDGLTKKVAKRFTESGGQIKPMLREILNSPEFKQSAGTKLKRPFQYVVSCLRATGADTMAGDPVLEFLTRMGHGPFQYPTPDGYPTEANPWLGTLLWRWNFAFALCSNTVDSANVSLDSLCAALAMENLSDIKNSPDTLFAYFTGRRPTQTESKSLKQYAEQRDLSDEKGRAELIGLILSSPAFQKV
jgi:uncharacterized protein (DUF1800 family)